MLSLNEVQGQTRAVELLQRALASGRISQAYLFSGPKHCGKHTTGIAFAKALNCLDAPNRGCHTCISCTKIAEKKHPDVRTLETEGKQKRISIDTIRKQVIPTLARPPHEGRARVFLIEEAAAMLGPAANALLKTLEEPPPKTHFILGCVAPIQLLPTIRSRCQRVNFQSLSVELQATFRGDDEQAETIRSLCQDIISVSDSHGLGNILDVGKAAGDRDTLMTALQQFAQYCHHCARGAVDIGHLPAAQIYGRRAAAALQTLVALRDYNAHGQLALEHLLVAMRGLPIPHHTRIHVAKAT